FATVVINSPTDITYTTGTIIVDFTGNAEHYWYYIEPIDVANQTWTPGVIRGLTDGTFTLHAYGNNSLGKVTYLNVIFTIDIPPPTVTITSPSNNTYLTTDNVWLNFTIDKPASWIGYSLNDAVNVTVTGNTALNSLSEGFHSIVLYANDTSGNMGTSSVIWFTVDQTPPTVTIIRPRINLDTTMKTESVKISWETTDNIKLTSTEVFVNGTLVARVLATCHSIEISLSQGLNNIEIVVYDIAGNYGSASISILIEEPSSTPTSTGFSFFLPLSALFVGGLLLRKKSLLFQKRGFN
ncbi:MAG: Ig-like domain-containing protein, partial [Candidatus Hodarchaeales archaeon]